MKKLIIALLVTTFSVQYSIGASFNDPDTMLVIDPKDPQMQTLEVYSSMGNLVYTGNLVKNRKEGVFRSFTETGSLKEIQEFHNDVPDGIHLIFGDNLSIETEENFRNGLLNGRRLKYRFGGIIKLREFYVDGKPDSLKISYYDNGFRQEESIYKNGLREGTARWYNQSEQILIEYHYKSGLLNGPAATFYDNGQPESEGQYLNDVEDGEWKYYDLKGRLMKTITYRNGVKTKEKRIE